LTTTAAPEVTPTPLIPAMNVAVCAPTTIVLPPMRIVFESPETPALAISMLLLPAVIFCPANSPIATLFLPVELDASASSYGVTALNNNTTGAGNTATGFEALLNNTTGSLTLTRLCRRDYAS
jgi:hypothetical protein